MSEQLPLSPVVDPSLQQGALSSQEQFFSDPNIDRTELQAGIPTEFTFNPITSAAKGEGDNLKTQELALTIQAGNEVYSIVRGERQDPHDELSTESIWTVAKMGSEPNSRATIVAVLDFANVSSFNLGRKTIGGSDGQLSAEHCLIELGHDGSVRITDTDSTNGTTVGSKPKFENMQSPQNPTLTTSLHWAPNTESITELLENPDYNAYIGHDFNKSKLDKLYVKPNFDSFSKKPDEAVVAHSLKDILQSGDLDNTTKQIMSEIVANGTLGGEDVTFNEVARSGSSEFEDRNYMAQMFARAPTTATALIENHIGGFHGTRSAALAGILEQGKMMSTRDLRKVGAHIVSGEHIYQPKEGQNTTSFATLGATKDALSVFAGEGGVERCTTEQVISKLEEESDTYRTSKDNDAIGNFDDKLSTYAGDNDRIVQALRADPNSLMAVMLRNDFPVALGISRDYVRSVESQRTNGNLLIGQSYQGEFRPNGGIVPIEALPVIGVPREIVADIEQLMKNYGHDKIAVVPIEDLQ